MPGDRGLRLRVKRFLKQNMKMKNSGLIALLALTLVAAGLNAQDLPSGPTRPVSVNDLAAKPGAHLGSVQVLGVVAAVSAGKGFVLVDPGEYAACGLSCLAEAGTAKIPVRWGGDAPKLEQTLRVAGTLSRTDQGLSFVAQELSRP